MNCSRAARKSAALTKRIGIVEPRRVMILGTAVKQFSVVRLSVVSRWIARVVKQVKRQM